MKLGDEIRVTFEATYTGMTRDGKNFLVDFEGNEGYGLKHTVPGDAVIEVLTPVDDPSNDLVGTVRKTKVFSLSMVKTAEDAWTCLSSVTHDRTYSDRSLEDCPIIGVVPGSPADKK